MVTTKKQNTTDNESDSSEPNILSGQECPMCRSKTLTLMESERDIPYFGKVYLFSMSCSNCKYHKADVECCEKGDPSKYTIEVQGDEDLNIRIVKSGNATLKIPHIITIESGAGSNGYITNVEGVLNRVKKQIESARDNAEEKEDAKKAKNLLKKLTRVLWGKDKLKIIIEDPTGNSAIISDKAVKTKLKSK